MNRMSTDILKDVVKNIRNEIKEAKTPEQKKAVAKKYEKTRNEKVCFGSIPRTCRVLSAKM